MGDGERAVCWCLAADGRPIGVACARTGTIVMAAAWQPSPARIVSSQHVQTSTDQYIALLHYLIVHSKRSLKVEFQAIIRRLIQAVFN